jgi:Tol biopolymer transport system component
VAESLSGGYHVETGSRDDCRAVRVGVAVVIVSLLAGVGSGCGSNGAVAVGNVSDLAVPASGATTPPPFRRQGEIVEIVSGRDSIVGIGSGGRILATCALPCRGFQSAAWSADGRWLAYGVATCVFTVTRPANGCNPESGLWVRSQGSEAHQLTGTCHVNACASEVWQWSPRGEVIADADSNHTAGTLQLIDPMSGWATPLVHTGKPIGTISWSPDGARIAFVAGDDFDVVTVSGKTVRQIATGVGLEPTVIWGGGGPRIAYDRFVGRHSQVVVDGADGAGRTVIAQGTKFEGPGLPAWSPTGDRIAYVTTPGRANHYGVDVWVVKPDGSQRTLLYRTPIGDPDFGQPVWSPNGAWVAVRFDAGWLAEASDGSKRSRTVGDAVVEGWQQRSEQPQETSG